MTAEDMGSSDRKVKFRDDQEAGIDGVQTYQRVVAVKNIIERKGIRLWGDLKTKVNILNTRN